MVRRDRAPPLLGPREETDKLQTCPFLLEW